MSSEETRTFSIYEVLAWLETNKTPLIIGFVAAVVLGFGIAFYRWNAAEKEVAASDALLQLKPSVAANATATQPDPEAYLKVAEQHKGTTAADRALLLAGSAFFTEGKYTEAQTQFNQFLRSNPQSPFAPTAAYGLAAALEAQGKTDEALAAYQNLPVRYPNSSVLDDAKLAIGRLYEVKNQPDQALRAYEELLSPSAIGGTNPEAAARKQALLARHPELSKTNAPASSAVPSVAGAATNAPGLEATNPVAQQP